MPHPCRPGSVRGRQGGQDEACTGHQILLTGVLSQIMPSGLRRFPDAHCLHFIAFSCYRRQKFLKTAIARNHFARALERTRKWYGFYVVAFVVMPEHVHLLISEPERKTLPIAIQMLKQIVSAKFGGGQFWQVRYYDDLVTSGAHRIEVMRYIHRNPVKRKLVERPEDWQWSSFNNHASGTWCGVEVESEWTGRERERMGAAPRVVGRTLAHPVAQEQKPGDKGGA
jgi:putative transposase